MVGYDLIHTNALNVHNDDDAHTATTTATFKEHDMKVSVDFDLCASTGACMQACPEVFEVRNDGYLYILHEHPGADLADKVRQAVDLCPTAAITLEE